MFVKSSYLIVSVIQIKKKLISTNVNEKISKELVNARNLSLSVNKLSKIIQKSIKVKCFKAKELIKSSFILRAMYCNIVLY